ncbi:Zinc finger CCCH domain-containing protein 1 [Camellia lanceoleosa]|uniref:Zinc finger CCCH domain-containing protein 1 n=1 Tax=Camellia lanceoleosa TaxID=1840588 RepID=A0ACC0I6I8_9ERIC|nr:Zinc finger CCCH domain-containing protein 1 [Camellia lanceoleosa]
MQASNLGSNFSMADLSEPQNQPEPVCNFFRKPSKNKNIRKRTFDENEDEAEDSKTESSLIHNKKKPPQPDNKLHFSTGPSKCSMPSKSNVESTTPIFQCSSNQRERVLKQAETALKGKSKNPGDEKLYKGIHGYTDYKAGFRREQTVSAEKAGGSHGPLRASAHIRVSARFDYQPDICKDYKETGYCGYGDSCKFMHDRGDYKSGWQMEEWDEAQKARKRNLAMGGDDMDEGTADHSDEDDEDALPFACFICRQPFVDPVVTRCKHYFCEHCALKCSYACTGFHASKLDRIVPRR